MKQQLVKDWMTPDVITITPDTSLYEAHRLMDQHAVRRLPVIEDGVLIGIVTKGDIRGAEPSDATSLSVWEINYLLTDTTVSEIMHRQPITISPNATIGEAANTMLEAKISGLPVVDLAGNVIGIITESDIFRLVVQDWISDEVKHTDLETAPMV